MARWLAGWAGLILFVGCFDLLIAKLCFHPNFHSRIGHSAVIMASRLLSEEDLSCPICCDIFRDPVVLKCSHSFCSACLQKYWGQKHAARSCPLCRTESLDEPVASLTLKNLCDTLIEEGVSVTSDTREECEPGELCRYHGERLKLFCLLDREPICVVCHTSRKHKNHECCPVEEAVVDIKVLD